jgi:hypothetical protein
MNNIKKMIMGFAAVAMIVGFSAFKNIKADHTYYPIKSGTTFVWQEIDDISNYECVDGAAACLPYETDSPTPPASGQLPSGYSSTQKVLERL